MIPDHQTVQSRWSGLRLFAVTCATTLASIAMFNAAVDPYGYFGTPVVPGLTERKPTAFTHDRFLKSGLAARSTADCLLAGNSRIGEGIPYDHAFFSGCRHVLDISLAGPNMSETRASVTMAIESHPAAKLVANIDFFSFNALRKSTRGGSDSTFGTDRLSRAKTVAAATITADATLDSLTTLVRQSSSAFYNRTGTVNQGYLAETSMARPTRATFLRGLRGYIFHMLPAPAHDFKVRTAESAPLEELRRFFHERQKSSEQTMLFISAPHAWQLEIIDALGLWTQCEEWKRSVARINEEVAQELGREPLALWDFFGYNAYTTEVVPADLGAIGPLVHYWDTSHFRHSLGARILDRMAGGKDSPGFGKRLTSDRVEQLLKDIREERTLWRKNHAQDVQDIRAVVACFAPKNVAIRLHIAKQSEDFCRGLVALTR